MGKHTEKVGIVGKYGTRFGANMRKRVKKIEQVSHARHYCHFCGKFAFRRKFVGVWHCRPCNRSVTGGAWTLSTPNATTVRSTIRRLRSIPE
eukprot:TRINITY_DN8721_c0_g2_i1.p2 TRINITY_DN8721_c0_g2~~TRINITY_DN8721_c0_g2_i1.p2  ORF type:complete len:100 (+),score=20.19 TRINITY_DN8721_c0_g2_i1:26-301(+)